ncbi:hypothetical protein JHL18_00515 [Clostridium sp. YIM B02505]|uniref:Uncharacterized protein n=1 Tax=Clostridium yunnanense TaxID=2800325 RepID=A0ABS1EIG1_9CLOT|nr:hypothetical protein [Clostridium yunnanense]MBK1809131.1 hypothetical protein [Clostridium yunnanense]
MRIKICSIMQSFYDKFDDSVELEKNEKRPCLIIIQLLYKGIKYDFAIPFRSNINGGAKRDEYFPLPPRKTTKKGKKHGLHYIKMFPISKQYIKKYYSENDENKNDITKIEKNLKQIVNEAQKYLEDYETGIRYNFCVDIDTIINEIYKEEVETQQEVAATEFHEEDNSDK